MICPGTELKLPPEPWTEDDVYEFDNSLCIGDIHGHLQRFQRLWINACIYFGEWMNLVRVIFLGDYCDRGPDTRGSLDLLAHLKASRRKHTYFIAGNHDFAMSSFLNLYPEEPQPDLSSIFQSFHNETLFTDMGHNSHIGMHIQGRRWAATLPGKLDSVFESAATFTSYGVNYGDRLSLLEAMPSSHKEFLRTLPWIVDLRCKSIHIIALHAGFDNFQPIEEQMEYIRTRRCDTLFVEAIAGRKRCVDAHPNLIGSNVVEVSGHFGFLDCSHPNRCIVDDGGGKGDTPLAALILPSRHILRDCSFVELPKPAIL